MASFLSSGAFPDPVAIYYQSYDNGVRKAVQDGAPDVGLIKRICDRYRGVGSDGVLVGQRGQRDGEASLRSFNSDGSEAEKSGNGLRILARHALDQGAR